MNDNVQVDHTESQASDVLTTSLSCDVLHPVCDDGVTSTFHITPPSSLDINPCFHLKLRYHSGFLKLRYTRQNATGEVFRQFLEKPVVIEFIQGISERRFSV